MKKFAVLFTSIIVLFTSYACGQTPTPTSPAYPQPPCPKTSFARDCFACHLTPDNRLKEIKPDSHLDYPPGFKFLDYPTSPKGYLSIGSIDESLAQSFDNILIYMRRHKSKYLILDIQSHGGGIFDAWKIKGLIDEFEAEGGIVETRLRGMALSAGFILFCAGTKGYRFANPQSELMLHEIGYYKVGGFFSIEKVTPSSAEEEAKMLMHLQKTICDWLATRGKISTEDLFNRLRFKEFWMSGKEAFELGYVDKLIGK